MIERDQPVTRAWVLHPDVKTDADRRDAGPALEEAVALAAALPGSRLSGPTSCVSRASIPHAVGSGKIEELKTRSKAEEVALVLIDGPVGRSSSATSKRNGGHKILDRTGLILEIFCDRARTAEGVLQVEMAALTYQRSRLVRAWTHLERQRADSASSAVRAKRNRRPTVARSTISWCA